MTGKKEWRGEVQTANIKNRHIEGEVQRRIKRCKEKQAMAVRHNMSYKRTALNLPRTR